MAELKLELGRLEPKDTTLPDVSSFTLSATAVTNGATYPRAPLNAIQIVPQ